MEPSTSGRPCGEFEQLWRADGAGGDDDPAAGPDVVFGASPPDRRPGAALRVEGEAQGVGVGHHGQVGAFAGGGEVGVVGAPAPSPVLVHLVVAEPGLVEVVVVHDPAAVLHRRLQEGVGHGEPLAHLGDVQGAGVSPSVARLGVVLDAAEVRLHIGVAPAGRAGGGPSVVVGGLAAQVHHAVDQPRTAEPAAARHGDGAALGVGVGLGLVTPVVARVAQHVPEARRYADERGARLAAGLHEQHPVPAGCAQAGGEDAAGGAAPEDHVVVLTHRRPCFHLKRHSLHNALPVGGSLRICPPRAPRSGPVLLALCPSRVTRSGRIFAAAVVVIRSR